MSEVAENLARVRTRIEAACGRVQRSPDTVQLIAVSKRHPPERIREAHAAGQRVFGENYAQELRDKAEALAALEGLQWHAIGGLQANKAKYVAKHAHVFHALDGVALATELSRRRPGAALPCFLEVNLAGEGSKAGVAPEAVAALLAQVRSLPQLEVVGLMALPPPADSPEATRPHFRLLRELARRLGLARLSMGTTQDFEVAVEEGATDVRVGEAIFGARPRPATSP